MPYASGSWSTDGRWHRQDALVDDATPTQEDYASLERASQLLHARGWIAAFSLNEMIAGWDRLVREVEEGYDATIDDFTNDLTTRDWIAEIRDLVTERVRSSIDERIEPIDDRYRRTTRADGGHALSQFFRIEGRGWWWRRVPKADTGELARYLRAHGVG